MPARLQLVIGNRNYSSWSLRAWLAVRAAGIPFEEVFIPLDRAESRAAILKYSASGLVPVLVRDSTVVWDSLAIIETVNELARVGLWPQDSGARAVARSVSAEMHAGFYRLRRDMPMDLRAERPGERHTDGALADARRVLEIWSDCRARFGGDGPYLFGNWSAADMMFAPVVGRFRTYGVAVNRAGRDYMDAVWTQPDMAEWVEKAREEPYEIEI